ncbi:hypothetical protein SAMN04488109_1216 [Chryseolinea serpens]|uniref:Uncharacterized protein n=1 Tax=Chryseolinea serpens TaxID=947013 RepID=A0A1M5LHK4_9BACT|nr:hypothetical protein SAMN04488109_1216 [Chryseolinea serpens]
MLNELLVKNTNNGDRMLNAFLVKDTNNGDIKTLNPRKPNPSRQSPHPLPQDHDAAFSAPGTNTSQE